MRKKNIKQKKKTFDFVLGKIKKSGKIFVIEKIGSISYSSRKININFFRFIFWLRYKPAVSLKAHKFLLKFLFRDWGKTKHIFLKF